MVVASRCFAFRALITQALIWKRFRVQHSTSLLYLPIPSSAENWKIVTNKLCQFFSRLSWHFNLEISILESIFLQNKNWSRVQDFVCKTLRLLRISLLISAITEFCVFFSGKLFYIRNRKLFFCVCIAWYKHSWVLENSRQLFKPSTRVSSPFFSFLLLYSGPDLFICVLVMFLNRVFREKWFNQFLQLLASII